MDAAELLVAREEEILLRQEEEGEERLPRQGEEGEDRPPSPVRVKDYAETIVPLYSGKDFKKHFRMQRETVPAATGAGGASAAATMAVEAVSSASEAVGRNATHITPSFIAINTNIFVILPYSSILQGITDLPHCF